MARHALSGEKPILGGFPVVTVKSREADDAIVLEHPANGFHEIAEPGNANQTIE
ncbi:hypothetical protein D9M68_956780 [compost metagenome]